MAVLARFATAFAALACLCAPALAVFGGAPVTGGPVAASLAAVLYRTADGTHLCTAVLLAPRLLLTAAHCTDGDRADIRIVFATELANVPADRLRSVAAVSRAEPTAAAKGTYAYNNPDDIALLLLESAAPADTRPAMLATTFAADVTIAGYGATSELRKADAEGRRQLGFDRQLRTARTTLTDKTTLLVAGQSGGAGMCTGDSGGPAFLRAGGAVAVTGLLIGVSAPRGNPDYCRGTAYFTSIPRWRDWIVSTARSFDQKL